MCSSVFGRLVTGVALVNKGNFNVIASDFLYLCCQFINLPTFLLIGWCDDNASKWPK
jgi:hypothetical protein